MGTIKPKNWFYLTIIIFMAVTTLGKLFLHPIMNSTLQHHDSIRIIKTVEDVFSGNHWGCQFTFKIGKRFLPIWGLKLLQILTLLPLCVASFFSWRNVVVSGTALSWEIRKYIVGLGALLMGYGSILLAANFGFLPRISQKSFLLHQSSPGCPIILPLFAVLTVIVLSYIGFHYMLRVSRVVYPNAALSLFLTAFLLITLIQIIIYTSLAAYFLLLPTIILWPLVVPSKFFSKQITNLILVLITFVHFLFVIGYSIHLATAGKWGRQLILAITSGYFPPMMVIFICALLAAYIQVIRSIAQPPESRQTQLKFNTYGQYNGRY